MVGTSATVSPARRQPRTRRRSSATLRATASRPIRSVPARFMLRCDVDRRESYGKRKLPQRCVATEGEACRVVRRHAMVPVHQRRGLPVLLHLQTWEEVEAYLRAAKGIIVPISSTEQ